MPKAIKCFQSMLQFVVVVVDVVYGSLNGQRRQKTTNSRSAQLPVYPCEHLYRCVQVCTGYLCVSVCVCVCVLGSVLFDLHAP